MSGIVDVFGNNILPIFFVAGLGAILRRWLQLDKKTLSRTTLYVLSPCLVFSSLASTQLDGSELAKIGLFALMMAAAMGIVTGIFGRAARLNRKETAAVMLGVIFANNGNYGLTINQLRYGEPGLARAIIYFTVITLITYTAGALIASSGSTNLRESVKKLLKLPAFYAPWLAILFYSQEWELPSGLMRGIEIAGAGAIPVMLLVLGMQMADLKQTQHLNMALPAMGLRLCVAPVIGLGVAALLGMNGISRNVSLLQASMPTAVVTIILATEFDALPELVTTIVVISTIVSLFTIPLAIALFGL